MTDHDNPVLFEVSKEKFATIHRFWMQLIVEPNKAIRQDFPRIIEILQAEQDLFGLNQGRLEPDDVFCLLNETTEFLTDPDVPCLGVQQLGYNPTQLFGELGVADIVAVGYLANSAA